MKVLIDTNVVEMSLRAYSGRGRFRLGENHYPSRLPYCSA